MFWESGTPSSSAALLRDAKMDGCHLARTWADLLSRALFPPRMPCFVYQKHMLTWVENLKWYIFFFFSFKLKCSPFFKCGTMIHRRLKGFNQWCFNLIVELLLKKMTLVFGASRRGGATVLGELNFAKSETAPTWQTIITITGVRATLVCHTQSEVFEVLGRFKAPRQLFGNSCHPNCFRALSDISQE